eukprot:Skav224225  [mRNA]  locus=scaffold939:1160061:1171627:+ [translate_table: standard]
MPITRRVHRPREESAVQSSILQEMGDYTFSIGDSEQHDVALHRPGRVIELPKGELMLRPYDVAERSPQASPRASVPSEASNKAVSLDLQRNEHKANPNTGVTGHLTPCAGNNSAVPARQTSKQSAFSSSNQEKLSSSRKSTSTVARMALNQSTRSFERVRFTDAVEPAMQLYLEDFCVDGPSAWTRALKTIGVFVSLMFLLPMLSFAALTIPFAPPEEGFLSNWALNFLAHPILNYVPARATLEFLSRIVEPSERYRVRWIVLWIPVVDPIFCLSIHSIASIFGVYPLPYAVVTGCIPGAIASTVVAGCLLPKDLWTADAWASIKFCYLSWCVWAFQFAVLMIWLLAFELFSPLEQALGSFAVTGMLAVVGWAVGQVGQWMGLPKYYTTEVKVLILFFAFLTTAALLSSSKTPAVFLLMLAQDAGKAVALLAKTWFYLAKLFGHEMGILDDETESVGTRPSKTWKFCWRCSKLKSHISGLWSAASEMSEELRRMMLDFQMHTQESLQTSNVKVADARLLDNFARYLVLFVMVDVCEVLVPLIYMIVASLLHAPGLGHNRQYFHIFKDMHFQDTMLANLIAFLIEALILLMAHMFFLRVLNFNLLHFAGIVLKLDFWYWTFALGTCCVAWATLLIEHTGHDLELIRSWLL